VSGVRDTKQRGVLHPWFVAVCVMLVLVNAAIFVPHFDLGYVITTAWRLAMPVLWLAAGTLLVVVAGRCEPRGLFATQLTQARVRAWFTATFGLAAIFGVVLGQVVGGLAGIEYIVSDKRYAADYRALFLIGASIAFIPATLIASLIALTSPRLWNSRLSPFVIITES
jgi:hypothetical protein